MDLEDWELLPRKSSFENLDLDLDQEAMMMDYFLCPSPPRSRVIPTQHLQVPIAWEPLSDHETTNIPNNYPDLDPDPDPDPDPKSNLLTESIPSPRVTFKKMKETEFVDMKMDPPPTPPARITSPLPPQIDAVKPSDSERGDDDLGNKKESDVSEKLNLWKIGLSGIGSICSFGVASAAAAAAATICVFFLRHHSNIKTSKMKNDQFLRFQIYHDDHHLNHYKMNDATKLNEAISVMKGVPLARAQISFGGYYDLL